MIDFNNASYVKLSPWDPQAARERVGEQLTQDEQVYLAFKGMRDFVIFTSKRLIAVNVQGLTGKKTHYTSLPTRGSRRSPSRPQAASTSTQRWTSGSAASASCGWSSRVASTSGC